MHRVLLLAAIAGCAAVQPRIETITETVEVPVPVAVPCVQEIPSRPAVQSDAEILALSDYGAVVALRRRDLLMQAWAAELEALLAACRR